MIHVHESCTRSGTRYSYTLCGPPPPAKTIPLYGGQAGGKHPTGMLSCLKSYW